MQFPKALSLSSTLFKTILSGKLFFKNCNSISVVVFGTNKPFLLPHVKRPTILVPPIDVWITGIWLPISDSKNE